MLTRSPPWSRAASSAGSQSIPNSAWPLATTCSGVMSGPPGLSVDVEALVLVVPLLERRVVAGELRLRHPLELQRDLVELLSAPSLSAPGVARLVVVAAAPGDHERQRGEQTGEQEPDPSLHVSSFPSFGCPLDRSIPGQSALDDGCQLIVSRSTSATAE